MEADYRANVCLSIVYLKDPLFTFIKVWITYGKCTYILAINMEQPCNQNIKCMVFKYSVDTTAGSDFSFMLAHPFNFPSYASDHQIN